MKTVAIRASATAIATLLASTAFAWNEGGGDQKEALGLAPDVLNGMEIFDSCAACHRSEGWGMEDGSSPQLAGQHRSVLIKQLTDIRSRKRGMPEGARCSSVLPDAITNVQDLADVAAYSEMLPMNPEWGKGPWGPETPEYAQGERIYKDNCSRCHGDAGMGNGEELLPRINGQHHEYLLRQLVLIRDGKRGNADRDMVKQIKGFTDEDMQLVINYVSWQQVPKDQLADFGTAEDRRIAGRGDRS
ncbi:MAG: c-type cytochrome [Chromatiaceae bacterium]|nr:c-type cytochrome [Chromatiaceae bacterium]